MGGEVASAQKAASELLRQAMQTTLQRIFGEALGRSSIGWIQLSGWRKNQGNLQKSIIAFLLGFKGMVIEKILSRSDDTVPQDGF